MECLRARLLYQLREDYRTQQSLSSCRWRLCLHCRLTLHLANHLHHLYLHHQSRRPLSNLRHLHRRRRTARCMDGHRCHLIPRLLHRRGPQRHHILRHTSQLGTKNVAPGAIRPLSRHTPSTRFGRLLIRNPAQCNTKVTGTARRGPSEVQEAPANCKLEIRPRE